MGTRDRPQADVSQGFGEGEGALAGAKGSIIVRDAFHNVAYFPGTFDALRSAVK